jgi:hypothetical protein
MLLYRMSQWMDERQRLQRELRGNGPESAHALQSQIQELEERLYGQAREWLASFQAPAAVTMAGVPYKPPALLDPEPDL